MNDQSPAQVEDLEVLGMKESDFNAWKHHPITKAFRQYLSDYREALLKDHLARWEAGAIDSTDQEARGRAISLKEMAAIEFQHIALFYQDPNEPNHEDQ
jgi:hypothetical protein